MRPHSDPSEQEPGRQRPDAEWNPEVLERLHNELLAAHRAPADDGTSGDSGFPTAREPAEPDGSAMTAARRVLGLIDFVRRRGKFSGHTQRTTVSGSQSAETPGTDLRDGQLSTAAPSELWTSGLSAAPITIGRFRICRELGRGGCGLVFLAEDPTLGRQVALKVPRPEMLASEEGRRRFLREARTAALLAHPNIVTVYEAGQEGPVLCLIAEWIDGPTLSEWIRQHPDMPDPRGAAKLVATLADAMQHAHSRGVLHRDLKPGNILLDLSHTHCQIQTLEQLAPYARVSDFGMARIQTDSRMTRTGDLVGSPSYLAPELIGGGAEAIETTADVYGLGAILYELLTGRPPFEGRTLAATLRAVEMDDPESPRRLRKDVPRDLEAICLKCLEKNPAARYASAAALAVDLERFLAGVPVEARRISGIEKGLRWTRRQPLLASLILTLTIVVTGSLAAMVNQLQAIRTQAQRTQTALEAVQAEKRRSELNIQRAGELISRLGRVGANLVNQPHVDAQGRQLLEDMLTFQLTMMQEQSEDSGVRLETGQACIRAGHIQMELGKILEAETNLLRGIQLIQSVLPAEQHSRDLQLQIAGARLAVGRELAGRRNHADARSQLQQGIDALEALLKATPQDREVLGLLSRTLSMFAHTYRGEFLTRKRRLYAGEGIPQVTRAIELANRMVDAAGNPEQVCEEQAFGLEVLSDLLQIQGEDSGVLYANFQREMEIRRKLFRQDPVNPDIRLNLSRTLRRHRTFAETDAASDWSASCVEALQLLRGLISEFPAVTQNRRDLSLICSLLGAHHEGNDARTASEYFVEGFRNVQGLPLPAYFVSSKARSLAELVEGEQLAWSAIRCFHLCDDDAAAILFSRRNLELSPEKILFRQQLAWCLAVQPNPSADELEEAWTLADSSRTRLYIGPSFVLTLALIQLRQGHSEEAIAILQGPDPSRKAAMDTAFLYMALAHAKLGNTKEARLWLTRDKRVKYVLSKVDPIEQRLRREIASVLEAKESVGGQK